MDSNSSLFKSSKKKKERKNKDPEWKSNNWERKKELNEKRKAIEENIVKRRQRDKR